MFLTFLPQGRLDVFSQRSSGTKTRKLNYTREPTDLCIFSWGLGLNGHNIIPFSFYWPKPRVKEGGNYKVTRSKAWIQEEVENWIHFCILSFHMDRVTVHPGLPRKVPVYSCYLYRTINSTSLTLKIAPIWVIYYMEALHCGGWLGIDELIGAECSMGGEETLDLWLESMKEVPGSRIWARTEWIWGSQEKKRCMKQGKWKGQHHRSVR